jgi:hypothetical protein
MTPDSPPPPPAAPPPRPAAALGPPTPSESDDAFLLRYLEAHEAPCPSCGYNLHALTQPRCPECGQSVRFKVGLRVPPMRAWVVMATATCASAGLGIIFAALGTRGRGRSDPTIAILFFYAAIPLATAVLLGRRRINRWDPRMQRAVATALSAMAGLAIFALVKSIF